MNRTAPGLLTAAALLLAGTGLAAAGDGPPSFIRGPILKAVYDGVTDDLLTGGLGKTGLGSAVPPGFADPLNPTATELRRRAIHTNYRALVDPTTGGGYGILYGPNIDLSGQPTLGEGKVAGEEHLAFAGDGSGKENVTLMVQVPASFDPGAPCVVTAPSSGSRGVYGAIATAGEWGLKRGCAVAYTDKGTGTGAHDLANDTVSLITGVRRSADEARKLSHFTARVADDERAAFDAATPNRFAFKHAHSQQNPEADWGRNVLQSIELAFFLLGQKFGPGVVTPANTIVIASSVSNGGGASLRAAEQDAKGLIDAVVVSEPNVNPEPGVPLAIVQGANPPVTTPGRNLLDYTTLVNVYQPCASIAQGAAAPLNFAASPNRCLSLKEKGLLAAATLVGQAAEAQAVINAHGILPEQNIVQPSHAFAFVPQSISMTYANAYGRASVLDNLCGYSLGATSLAGDPTALVAAAEAALFAVANGIPPTGGVNLVNNLSAGGPKEDRVSVSPSTGRQDQNLDGALCLRALATGVDPVSGQPLDGAARDLSDRARSGIRKVLATGRLRGTPALIVTGRADAILPPNHTSRAYYGLNRLLEGDASSLRYVEVTNAHHLDAFNAFPGFDSRMVPLHHYFIQAMNLMYDHLTLGTALPPSQVVRTTPRGAGAPAITLANVPPIQPAPAADARITIVGDTVHIPE